MSLAPGTRLGRYEIRGLLGAGGMGEVYRARDSQLERDVAVKVLPAEVAASAEAVERFEREARAVAGLAHPNILAIFDFGHQDGRAWAAMELLEGETLRAKLEAGPPAPRKTVELASQLAEALGAAHDRGVVHRDIKPENIFLTREGLLKVLDFGLAQQQDIGLRSGGNDSKAPTRTRLTAAGTVMGTLGYMAPEQVLGRSTDHRTDIFAFGCVLYEMLTGRRAFEKATAAETIAAILREEPAELPTESGAISPILDRVVRRCVEKNPEERFQSARDLAFAVGTATSGSQALIDGPVLPTRRPLWRYLVAMGVAAAVAGTAALELAPKPPRTVTNLAPPEGHSFNAVDGPPALTRDGRRIAFLAARPGEPTYLFVRSLDGPEAVRIEDTRQALMPFWSPDGRYLAFFADGKLKRVEVPSGRPEELADAADPMGGSWAADGTVIFVGTVKRPPQLIDPAGQVSQLPAPYPGHLDSWYQWPSFLPDGRHYLLAIQDLGTPDSGIHVVSVDGRDPPRRLTRTISNAAYVEPGWLLFWEDGNLEARRFDAGSLELGREPVRLAEGVGWGHYLTYGRFAVSQTGILVYQPGSGAIGDTELVRVDRQGNQVEIVGPRAEYYSPRISHDGRRVAVDITDIQTTHGDIWILDRERGTRTRVTSTELDESDPVWLADDSEIFYRRVPDLFRRDAEAARPEEAMLADRFSKEPEDLSPDGRHLLFESQADGRIDLRLLDVESGKAVPWLAETFQEEEARFAPNGRWVAYESDETGAPEVYVRSFPDGRERSVISTVSGGSPVWRADGSELFYHSTAGAIVAVPVTWTADRPRFGEPRELFRTRIRDANDTDFDVFPDGRSFLLNRLVAEVESGPLVFVQGWQTALPEH